MKIVTHHREREHLAAARGFTLIELMIVVAVVGILAMVAYPSFLDQVRKSRRADAVDVLTRLQQAQERWRGNNPTYATLAQTGFAATSPQGYYTIAVAVDAAPADATSYTLTATAVAGKSQASDTGCTMLTLRVAAGTPSSTPPRCWGR